MNNEIQNKIKAEIKAAMMAKDTLKLTVVRGLSSAFTNELVNKGKMPTDILSDEDALTVIRRNVKQRKDAMEQFIQGGREDLAENEKAELVILEAYLPEMMKEEDVKDFILKKKDELGITDKKDIGKFMSEIMKELKGKADGAMIKQIVDSLFV